MRICPKEDGIPVVLRLTEATYYVIIGLPSMAALSIEESGIAFNDIKMSLLLCLLVFKGLFT